MNRPEHSTGTTDEPLVIVLEVQVLRDMKALTRPSIHHIPFNTPHRIAFAPGYAMGAMESVAADINLIAFLHTDWIYGKVRLLIDNLPMGSARPVTVFLGDSDIPGGVCQFMPAAADEHPSLGGWHTMTFRRVK